MRRAAAHTPPARLPASSRASRVSLPRRAPPVARMMNLPGAQSHSCACGGRCPRCSAGPGGTPPPGVRFHPSAPEVTAPLHARAVTIGQDVYFHPGQFQPGQPEGDALIAHELAHTLQTRGMAPRDPAAAPAAVSQSGDAVEKNADELASGQTAQVLAAPAGTVLRSPLDGESADDSSRRTRLIRAVHHAEANLIRLLQAGGLVGEVELAAERAGVRGVVVPASTLGRSDENFVTYGDRELMLRRIIRNLIAMATYYRTNPIPGTLPPAVADAHDTFTTEIDVEGGSSSYGGTSPDWSQLQAAYELYRINVGQTGDDYFIDWHYLTPDLQVTPGAARGARRFGRGTPSGAYMVFPDIEHEPLRYWRLTGYDPIPRGSVIVEFWHDDIGYYYMHDDQRIDVPNPWR